MTAPRLAWGLWFAFVVVVAVSLALLTTSNPEDDEGLMVLLIGYATVGAMIASRQSRNPVGWLLLAIAIAFALQGFGEIYVSLSAAPGREWVGWFAGWSWYVWITLTGVFLPLVFPDGRVLSPRWRPVAWLGVSALALSVVGAAFKPGDLDLSAPVQNPLGAHGPLEALVAAAAPLGNVLATAAFVLAGTSLIMRLRRARGTARAQLKWFVLVGVLAGTAMLLALTEVLFPGDWRRVVGAIGWFSFLLLAVVGIPAATGIAILHHRLYDIDVVINRTLVYGALTIALGAAYLGLVLLLGLTVGESDVAIAGSTLAVAALFRPARARIQGAVDRRFYRRRYDASLTLEAFSARLRDEIDLDAVGAELSTAVRDTVQPAHLSLWVRR